MSILLRPPHRSLEGRGFQAENPILYSVPERTTKECQSAVVRKLRPDRIVFSSGNAALSNCRLVSESVVRQVAEKFDIDADVDEFGFQLVSALRVEECSLRCTMRLDRGLDDRLKMQA